MSSEQPKVRRLGRYLLGRRIGAGGMAAVFAARQQGPLDLARLVAVKVMSTALVGDASYESMFLREARITQRLEHPNIVRVYEVDEADGTLFIAMEFVRGASLRDLARVEGGPPPLPISLRVLRDVATALHAAHELRDAEGQPLSLVHQDVSPHNIMITYDGITKLLDFGVARVGAMDASRTETIRGKPSYLAPEQIKGARIDRRTDVFALGIVMYELLTGKRLFGGSSQLEVFAAVASEAIPSVSDSARDLPPAVAAVCDRALQREPTNRFPDAAAFAQALEQARLADRVPEIAPREMGDWVTETAPPEFTLTQLEREIIHSTLPGNDDIADLPTQRPELDEPITVPPSTSRVRARALRSAGSWWPWRMLAAGLMLLLGGIVAFVLMRSTTLPESVADDTPSTSSSQAGSPPPTVSLPPPDDTAVPPPTPTTSDPWRTPPPPPPLSPSSPASSLPRASVEPIDTSAPPVTSAPPPAIQTSTLAVRSTPFAAVFIDGINVGTSTIVVPVKPGTHTVSARTEDGQQQSRSVTLAPGERRVVQFVF